MKVLRTRRDSVYIACNSLSLTVITMRRVGRDIGDCQVAMWSVLGLLGLFLGTALGGSFSEGDYAVEWELDEAAGMAYFSLTYDNVPDNFWTAVGFGPSMVPSHLLPGTRRRRKALQSGSDAVAAVVYGGVVSVRDLAINGYDAYSIITESGSDAASVSVQAARIDDGRLSVQFSRPLAAADANVN